MALERIAQPRLAVTVVIVHDDPFEVLIVRRPARGAFPMALAFPGGSVEAGETLEEAAIRETLEETAIDLAGVPFSPIGHWITPEGAPRRFDTHFLLASLKIAVAPVANEGELDGAFWGSPGELIRKERAREELVTLPTLAHLSLIEAAGSATRARALAQRRTVTPVMPRMRSLDDGTLIGTVPQAAGYPIYEWVNWTKGAR